LEGGTKMLGEGGSVEGLEKVIMADTVPWSGWAKMERREVGWLSLFTTQ
jgi:hypothetical protein